MFVAFFLTYTIHTHNTLQLISSIVNRDWTQLVRCSHLDNWREVLAAVVTYAGPEEFSPLCGEGGSGGRREGGREGKGEGGRERVRERVNE